MTEEEFNRVLEEAKKDPFFSFEQTKYRFAEKAQHIFGKPAVGLTDGQWLYILLMESSFNKSESKVYKVRKRG